VEPVVEFRPAAISLGNGSLRPAARASSRAAEAHMEVIIVAPPRPHFCEPRPIATGVVTEHLLDCGLHENAFDNRIRGRKLDELCMDRRPSSAIDI
jgi:hypothetical protein